MSSLNALQKDMLAALDADQKKEQLNDAKLRAVAQKVEYEDFEKLVLGAHLRPVKPRSQKSADVSKPFAGFVMPKYDGASSSSAKAPPRAAAAPAAPTTPALPSSSSDFLRAWRRQCKTPAERYAYLRRLEPESMPLLFRAELEPAGPADLAARDSWRARLWTFLVRPYLETLWLPWARSSGLRARSSGLDG